MQGSRPFAPAAALLWLLVACRAAPEPKITIRAGEIEFPATVGGPAFDRGLLMPGYHAVVWKGGRASELALLRAEVSDRSVLAALQSLGARPGKSLPMEAWRRRNDPRSAAPDLVIDGPAVDVLLRIPGRRELVPLRDVLDDPGGKGIAMRFAGNERNIPIWKSGCIVCLYSCPGSKVGNARYTERDYAASATRFRRKPALLPAPGTPVAVVLRVR